MHHHNQYTKARRRWINTVGYSLLSAICAATLVISVAREITVREIASYVTPVYAASPHQTLKKAQKSDATVPEVIYSIGQERGLTLQQICNATNGENCQVIY